MPGFSRRKSGGRTRRSPIARPRERRRGASLIELAVCLPVITLIVLGSIETANVLFLRQAVVQASYEGAKVAIHRKGTAEAAEDAARRVTAARQMDDVEVTFDPPVVQAVPRGLPIRVTVTAPGSTTSLFNLPPFNSMTITGTAVMIKE